MLTTNIYDWLLEKHSIAIRGKKWYWCLFTRVIDMALVNASILYRNIHRCNSMTMKDFRRAVTVKYLKLGIGRKVLKGRPYSFASTSKFDVSDDVRYGRVIEAGEMPKDAADLKVANQDHLHFV